MASRIGRFVVAVGLTVAALGLSSGDAALAQCAGGGQGPGRGGPGGPGGGMSPLMMMSRSGPTGPQLQPVMQQAMMQQALMQQQQAMMMAAARQQNAMMAAAQQQQAMIAARPQAQNAPAPRAQPLMLAVPEARPIFVQNRPDPADLPNVPEDEAARRLMLARALSTQAAEVRLKGDRDAAARLNDRAGERLRDLVEKFPDTRAAADARAMLERLAR